MNTLINTSCNMSLLVPSKEVTRRAMRTVRGSDCDNIGWDINLRPGSSERRLYFPAMGLGPCAKVTRGVVYRPECWRQEATCSQPEKSQVRTSVVCEPELFISIGVVPDCVCPDEPVVVIIDDGIVITLPMPVPKA